MIPWGEKLDFVLVLTAACPPCFPLFFIAAFWDLIAIGAIAFAVAAWITKPIRRSP